MRTRTKIWLILAAFLIIAGVILFGAVMTGLGGDFMKLSTQKFETNTYEITEDFRNLSLHTNTANIRFVPAEDGRCKVVCFEEENANHSVTVRDDTLEIQVTDNRSWYDHIGICFGSPQITVYLPQEQYAALKIEEDTGDVDLPKDFRFEHMELVLHTGDVSCAASVSGAMQMKATTGNIRVENTSVGSMDLSVTTGMITVSNVVCQTDARIDVTTGRANLTDIRCQNLTSQGSTGDIHLKNVVAVHKLSIERSTGVVRFEGSDAGEIFVKTVTGEVSGSLLSDKEFIAQAATGRVDVPKTASGGRCEIITTTGSIHITVEN